MPERRWSETARRGVLSVHLPAALAAGVGMLTIALTYGVFAGWATLGEGSDLATYLLPVRGLLDGGPVLYVDLFDIKPPLTYAFLVPVVALTGGGLVWLWAVYALLLALMLAGTWLMLRSVLPPWPSLVPFASACVIGVFFSLFNELFFATEVLGMTLVLGALVLVTRAGTGTITLVAAGALTGAAGQVKEVFLFSVLALLPLALRHRRGPWAGAASVAGGVLAALLASVVILLLWGSGALSGYLEVLGFKRERFPAPSVGEVMSRLGSYAVEATNWVPFALVLAVAVTAAGVMARRRRAPLALLPTEAALLLLLVGVLLGFVWQGAPFTRHYALALLSPVLLALSAVAGWGWRASAVAPTTPQLLVRAGLLVGLLPSVASMLWFYGALTTFSPSGLVTAVGDLESDAALEHYRAPGRLTDEGECIQVAYGWSAPAYYWYAERDPCSRFYVPPLDLGPALAREHQDQLIRSAPALIVYDPELAGTTTIPVEEGTPDTVLFPFRAVVAQCYEPVPGESLLFRRAGSPGETSRCIAEQVSREIRR